MGVLNKSPLKDLDVFAEQSQYVGMRAKRYVVSNVDAVFRDYILYGHHKATKPLLTALLTHSLTVVFLP
jgi:hypothetical protein